MRRGACQAVASAFRRRGAVAVAGVKPTSMLRPPSGSGADGEGGVMGFGDGGDDGQAKAEALGFGGPGG